MDTYVVSGLVQRFPGPKGWTYLELDAALEKVFRPLVQSRWPALVGVDCAIGETSWRGSVMPIRQGPLFITLPAPVRRALSIEVGQEVTVRVALRAPAASGGR